MWLASPMYGISQVRLSYVFDGVDLELVDVQADRPALADDALVGLGPRHERRVVRLAVRHQDQQRLVHRQVDLLFLVDLQAVGPAGEVDHADREQVRMIRDEDVGLQDLDALVPELVLHELVERDVLEPVFEELLRDVVEAADLGEHGAGAGAGLRVQDHVVAADADVGRHVLLLDPLEELVALGVELRLELVLGLVRRCDRLAHLLVRVVEAQPVELLPQLAHEQGHVAEVENRVDLAVLVQREHVVEDVAFGLGVDAVLQVRRRGLADLDEARIEQVLELGTVVEDRRVAGGELAGDAELGPRVVHADLGDVLVAARRDDRIEPELAEQRGAPDALAAQRGHAPLDADGRSRRA